MRLGSSVTYLDGLLCSLETMLPSSFVIFTVLCNMKANLKIFIMQIARFLNQEQSNKKRVPSMTLSRKMPYVSAFRACKSLKLELLSLQSKKNGHCEGQLTVLSNIEARIGSIIRVTGLQKKNQSVSKMLTSYKIIVLKLQYP